MKEQLYSALLTLLEKEQQKSPDTELYVVGGCVRDMLSALYVDGTADIDIVLKNGCHTWAKSLAGILGGGTVIPLSDTEGERATRFVWQGEQLDFADWRSGAQSLEEDLWLRDFSINAMALPFVSYVRGSTHGLIDPTGGQKDLAAKTIRHLPKTFVADSLRMLRAYRFYAKLGFAIAPETERSISENAQNIQDIAPERISYELRQIFVSPLTAQAVARMDASGLLYYLVPELYLGKGVAQPKEFHHLNVLEHGFLALKMAEEIAAMPEKFCDNPQLLERLQKYLDGEKDRSNNAARLKSAALLHDIGKPETKQVNCTGSGEERVSFYGHDKASAALFEGYAERSRWSIEERQHVGRLISLHMHPFHLLTAQRKGELGKKGVLRFCRRAGDELYGLFMLALADTLAGNPQYHQVMSLGLMQFFKRVDQLYREEIEPITTTKPLINGKDLIVLGFSPGALFREIFTAVEDEQVEGEIKNREMAIDFIRDNFLERQDKK